MKRLGKKIKSILIKGIYTLVIAAFFALLNGMNVSAGVDCDTTQTSASSIQSAINSGCADIYVYGTHSESNVVVSSGYVRITLGTNATWSATEGALVQVNAGASLTIRGQGTSYSVLDFMNYGDSPYTASNAIYNLGTLTIEFVKIKANFNSFLSDYDLSVINNRGSLTMYGVDFDTTAAVCGREDWDTSKKYGCSLSNITNSGSMTMNSGVNMNTWSIDNSYIPFTKLYAIINNSGGYIDYTSSSYFTIDGSVTSFPKDVKYLDNYGAVSAYSCGISITVKNFSSTIEFVGINNSKNVTFSDAGLTITASNITGSSSKIIGIKNVEYASGGSISLYSWASLSVSYTGSSAGDPVSTVGISVENNCYLGIRVESASFLWRCHVWLSSLWKFEICSFPL